MSEQHPPEFEDRLRALLSRAAEAIPPNVDLSARVRQTLMRPAHRRRLFGIVFPRNAQAIPAIVAAALVVALLAATLTFVHPGELPRPGGGQTIVPLSCQLPDGVTNPSQPAGTPVDHSVAVGRSARAQGITLTIDRVYADATGTVVTYHILPTDGTPATEWVIQYPVILDAQGHRYAFLADNPQFIDSGYEVFAPLPSNELGNPQTLTFLAQQLELPNSTGTGEVLNGPWSVSFDVTPTVGTSTALSVPAATHNHLKVQPLQIDVAPVGGGLAGVSGGVRVVVRVSGLSPRSLIRSLNNFDTANGPGGSVVSCEGGGILELVLPDGQQIAPSVIVLLNQLAPETPAEFGDAQIQTIGQSGTVDVEALFYVPIQSTAGLTLYMDQLNQNVEATQPPHHISGPWEFHLP